MGSDSDLEIMREAEKRLDYFGIAYETRIMSAHRTPESGQVRRDCQQRGLEVIICRAGAAAHLAGPSLQTQLCRSSVFPLILPASKV
jgi:phosphoribosylaminoimidazole carboxylase PurE protein